GRRTWACVAAAILDAERSTKVCKKGLDLVRQRFGLFEGRKVSALGHDAPARDVAVGLLGQGPWRTQNLLGKLRIARRYVDGGALRDRPGAVQAGVVGPERCTDRRREPIKRNIGQHFVTAQRRLRVAVADGPGAEFFNQPGGEADRRVGEPECQGLRARSLDPLLAGLLAQEMVKLTEACQF